MSKEIPRWSDLSDDERLAQLEPLIREIALEQGFRPPVTHFEISDAEYVYESAAYTVPGRVPLWTNGRDYAKMKARFDLRLERIYECIFNAEQPVALLLENNKLEHNCLVSAHALGHAHFFEHNKIFRKTRKDMMEVMPRHKRVFAHYEDLYGAEVVEHFLEAAYTIWMFVDMEKKRRPNPERQIALWKKEYEQQKEIEGIPVPEVMPFPLHPDCDLPGFIADFSPILEDWQRDGLHMMREEALYILAQIKTKITNEAFAAYTHDVVMSELAKRDVFSLAENVSWFKMDANGTAPTEQLNVYAFKTMFVYIEDFYNGRLKKQERKWLESQGIAVPPEYVGDRATSPGRKKAIEVAESIEDDKDWIDRYFDKNVADRLAMEFYEEQVTSSGEIYKVKIEDGWLKYKQILIDSLNHFPKLVITHADFAQTGGIYIQHQEQTEDLDIDYLELAMPYLSQYFWGKSVWLETKLADAQVLFLHDGKKLNRFTV